MNAARTSLDPSIRSSYADLLVREIEVGPRAAVGGASIVGVPTADEAFALVWRYLVDAGSSPGSDHPADALFCFGSRDRTVPAHAAALHARGVAPLVVVAGGGDAGGGRREADVFAADLAAAGVPRSAIVVERMSRHTGENVVAGMAALAPLAEVGSVVAVAWPLAARRCRATFARHHPELAVRSAPAIDGGRRWPRTERTVRAALGEVDRLHRYVDAGYVVADPVPASVAAAADVLRADLVAAQVA